jgi:hypothetical protein
MMRYTVVASMRDEGPFIAEWVAWYRALGFTHIVIVTNDCSDRSPALLDALAAAGWVTHLRHEVPPGKPPLLPKLAAARRHLLKAGAGWVFVCDVDEFLVVHRGQGRITDLVGAEERGFLGMAVNWMVFGSGGNRTWEDGLVHRQFLRSAGPLGKSGRWVKSIFRRPAFFKVLREHGPWRYDPAAAGGPWGEGGRLWVNSLGEPLANWDPALPYPQKTASADTAHGGAQVNHYMIRSTESFSLKRGRPSTVSGRLRYTDAFLESYDRNDFRDLSAQRRPERFDAAHAAAMAAPGVARLHHLCCVDYVVRLAKTGGLDPQDDPRLAHHLAAAEAAAEAGLRS